MQVRLDMECKLIGLFILDYDGGVNSISFCWWINPPTANYWKLRMQGWCWEEYGLEVPLEPIGGLILTDSETNGCPISGTQSDVLKDNYTTSPVSDWMKAVENLKYSRYDQWHSWWTVGHMSINEMCASLNTSLTANAYCRMCEWRT